MRKVLLRCDLVAEFTGQATWRIGIARPPEVRGMCLVIGGPSPWYHGRAILIGDAAHTTTPHMTAGALIAIQDAVVLADELQRDQSVAAALDAFMDRRYERCKMLVDGCRQIGEWQKAGRVRGPETGQLQSSVMAALATLV